MAVTRRVTGDGRWSRRSERMALQLARSGWSPSKRVFLDVSHQVSYGGERGLLGLAFHPNYASNGFLYINYTDRSGDTQVVRYTVRADRDSVEAGSAKSILTVIQPFANHNGGMLAF